MERRMIIISLTVFLLVLLKPAFSAETQSKIINVAVPAVSLLQGTVVHRHRRRRIQKIRHGSALHRHRRADDSGAGRRLSAIRSGCFQPHRSRRGAWRARTRY